MAIYYIASDGSNSGTGSSGDPWLTFAYAFSQMSAADELILKDGTYTAAINGGIHGRYEGESELPPNGVSKNSMTKITFVPFNFYIRHYFSKIN